MVYQVSVPRRETIREGSEVVPPSMGISTVINFQPTGGRKAAITWDLVRRPAEVNPVIRALRHNGIQVAALHSHMLGEKPRLFFMHFWSNEDAATLAKGYSCGAGQDGEQEILIGAPPGKFRGGTRSTFDRRRHSAICSGSVGAASPSQLVRAA